MASCTTVQQQRDLLLPMQHNNNTDGQSAVWHASQSALCDITKDHLSKWNISITVTVLAGIYWQNNVLRKTAHFRSFLFCLSKIKIQSALFSHFYCRQVGLCILCNPNTKESQQPSLYSHRWLTLQLFCFPPTSWRATKHHYISCINTRQWDPHEGLYSNTLFLVVVFVFVFVFSTTLLSLGTTAFVFV